jgi:hypothetical protein
MASAAAIVVDWDLVSLLAVPSRFRREEPWQQSAGIGAAAGLVSIFRFDRRGTNLSEPYSASFEQLRKPGPIHKYVMAF